MSEEMEQTETRERVDGTLTTRENAPSNTVSSFAPNPLPDSTSIPPSIDPSKESQDDARNITSSSDSPFISLAKMIGLEDPEDVEPFKDTITHLQIVISNLECFEFTEQRRTAMRRMTELIMRYLDE